MAESYSNGLFLRRIVQRCEEFIEGNIIEFADDRDRCYIRKILACFEIRNIQPCTSDQFLLGMTVNTAEFLYPQYDFLK